MEYTKGECECKVVISPDQKGYGIIYCPKHEAAPDMYEAGKNSLQSLKLWASQHPDDEILALVISEQDKALAKAELKWK